MLPNGTYVGKGASPMIWSETPNGKEQVVVKLVVTKGEFTGQTVDFRGSLEGGAVPITRRQIEALGYVDGDDNSVTKKETSFKVYAGNYNGKETVEVQILTGIEYKQMSSANAAAAKARFKAGSAAPKKTETEEEPF